LDNEQLFDLKSPPSAYTAQEYFDTAIIIQNMTSMQ